MADFIICEEQDLQNIADAIRQKTGSTETMMVSEMAEEINNISVGSGGGVGVSVSGSSNFPNFDNKYSTVVEEIIITNTFSTELVE